MSAAARMAYSGSVAAPAARISRLQAGRSLRSTSSPCAAISRPSRSSATRSWARAPWQSRATFVLLHKLREAMAEEMKGRKLGGEGKVAEVDGGYFGGYVKPANHVENRRDRRLARNQTGKRKAVVIIRERNGRSLPLVFRTEGQAFHSSALASPKERLSTRTKAALGMRCTP